MILKPFRVNSPDGKNFYEGDAPDAPDMNAIPKEFLLKFGAYPCTNEDRALWLGRLEGWRAATHPAAQPSRAEVLEEALLKCKRHINPALKPLWNEAVQACVDEISALKDQT